jgi:riboflavin biosynthesis pyrimidine reductase
MGETLLPVLTGRQILLEADALDMIPVRMLLPTPGPTSVADAYAGTHRTRRDDRPWIVMTMISTVDGAIAIEGNSGPLGGPADREVFLHLHRSVDTVLVGAETVRQEVYSPLPAHQTLVVVSSSGDLGRNGDVLKASPNTRVVAGEVRDIARGLPGESCALEGGPRLNAQMLAADLVDEVCLTVSPMLLGGRSARVAEGTWSARDQWRLVHVLESDGYLFLRYLRPGT